MTIPIGTIVNKLIVVEKLGRLDRHQYLCQCECGKFTKVCSHYLRTGRAKSCGCWRPPAKPRRIADLSGKTFGKLTVVELGSHEGGVVKWKCRCDCGKITLVTPHRLNVGHTTSCGCAVYKTPQEYADKRPVPGTDLPRTHLPEYGVWRGMKARCLRETCKEYQYYGARGISIDNSWLIFENFYRDMGPRPSSEHEIDRIDTLGWYAPGNCRWTTSLVQGRNTRRAVKYTYKGETKFAWEWADKFGTRTVLLRQQVKRVGLEKAFERYERKAQ